MKQIMQDLIDKLFMWMHNFVLILPNLIVALLVVVLAMIIGFHLSRLTRAGLARVSRNAALDRFMARLVHIAVVIIAGLVALNILKWDEAVFSILAGISIVGLALAFAFQDVASNFIAGTVLVFRRDRPFKVGDIIETNEHMGIVREINLRDSMIHTFDGRTIFIPNRIIFENSVINYTFLGKRRLDLNVGISYGDDLEKVKEVTLDALKSMSFRMQESEIEFFYEEFGDSSINFQVRIWIEFQSQKQYLAARSEAIMAIKRAFDLNDITIPFPIRTLDFGIKGGVTMAEMLPANRK